MRSPLDRDLEAIIEPVVVDMGFSLVGVECQPQSSLIRIFIEGPQGVTAEDCARISRQIKAVLSVESPLKKEASLEVSSPGLDRRLFTLKQVEAQLGKQVAVRLIKPQEGSRNYQGCLKAIEGEEITIETGTSAIKLLFSNIERANIIPKW